MFSRFSVYLKGKWAYIYVRVDNTFKNSQCVSFSTVIAHPAYDFEEFAIALKNAFTECKVVMYLRKFTNFRDAVEPLLNTASNTPGADSFSLYR
mgnify:CR=1 FL=1